MAGRIRYQAGDGNDAVAAVTARLHPTARIEPGAEIGDGTAVWDHVHIRGPSRIGRDCIIGEKTYIAYDVAIGDRVKINAFVYVCAQVTIETGVMIAAGTIFTNDRFPRATTPDLTALRSSAVDEHTLPTLVREGATIGAGCVIGCGLEIGRFAMVGMASVVTRSVADFHLVIGHPARTAGYVCRCGEPILRFEGLSVPPTMAELTCPSCSRRYDLRGGHVIEHAPPPTGPAA